MAAASVPTKVEDLTSTASLTEKLCDLFERLETQDSGGFKEFKAILDSQDSAIVKRGVEIPLGITSEAITRLALAYNCQNVARSWSRCYFALKAAESPKATARQKEVARIILQYVNQSPTLADEAQSLFKRALEVRRLVSDYGNRSFDLVEAGDFNASDSETAYLWFVDPTDLKATKDVFAFESSYAVKQGKRIVNEAMRQYEAELEAEKIKGARGKAVAVKAFASEATPADVPSDRQRTITGPQSVDMAEAKAAGKKPDGATDSDKN